MSSRRPSRVKRKADLPASFPLQPRSHPMPTIELSEKRASALQDDERFHPSPACTLMGDPRMPNATPGRAPWEMTQAEYAGPPPRQTIIPRWEVRVRYEGNPAGPLRGKELIIAATPPCEGDQGIGAFGRYRVVSKRPKQVGHIQSPASLTEAEDWNTRRRDHRVLVFRALAEGLPVPREVLAAYPEAPTPPPGHAATPPRAPTAISERP